VFSAYKYGTVPFKTNVKYPIIDATRPTRKSLSRTSTLKFCTIRHAPCDGGIKVAKGTSVSNVLSSVKRPIYFHLAPLVLSLVDHLFLFLNNRLLSLSSSIAFPSLLIPPSPSSLGLPSSTPWYYLPPFNWDLPSRSNPPSLWPTRRATMQCFSAETEVWQHRESGCASRSR